MNQQGLRCVTKVCKTLSNVCSPNENVTLALHVLGKIITMTLVYNKDHYSKEVSTSTQQIATFRRVLY